jgi:competence protein ComEC
VEPSPANKRYRAFADCIDEPLQIENQNKLQHYGDRFRRTLQQLTSERYETLGAELLPGLVVGDTSRQSTYLEDTLQQSGLGHLTAVSGANVAIVLVAVGLLLKRTRLSRFLRLLVLLIALGAYQVVVRPEPSVVRASVMAVIALGYWFLGLKKNAEVILLTSVIALLLLDPWLAISWGFALSVSATFGLIVFPKFLGITSEDHFIKKALGVALSAGIATFPVLLAMGANPTLASIVANVLAEIFVAPATILGLLAAFLALFQHVFIIGGLFLMMGQFLADCAVVSAQVICWVAEFALDSWFHIPLFSIPSAVLIILFIGIWRKTHSNDVRVSASILFITFLVVLNLIETTAGDWRIAACDVGQGDSILIRTAEHSAVMVDTGDDPAKLRACLEYFDIEIIQTLVISHIHQDHYGAFEVLDEFRPENVVIPKGYVTESFRYQLSKIFPEVIVGEAGYGQRHSYGQWHIIQVGEEASDSGTDVNNSGIVIYAFAGGVDALLLADIEVTAQQKLVSSAGDWGIDIVKIAHHGSRYQHPEFAKELKAKIGWVSVGQDNSYSHPHPEMMALYKAAGTRLFSTEECGHLYFDSSSKSILTSRACSEL